METTDTLEKAIEKAGGLRKLAKVLDVTPGYLSEVRHKKKALSPTRAVEIAAYVGANEHVAAMQAQADHAKSPEERAVWRRLAASVSIPAILALVVTALVPGQNASAATISASGLNCHQLFIMRSMVREVSDPTAVAAVPGSAARSCYLLCRPRSRIDLETRPWLLTLSDSKRSRR